MNAEVERLRAEGWEEVTDPHMPAQYGMAGRRWNGPGTAKFMALRGEVKLPEGVTREAYNRELRRMMHEEKAR